MDFFVTVPEVMGVIAFAVSGALTAIKKNMDLFGVVLLGFITTVGGGIMRDIILGRLPPMIFYSPAYAAIAAVTALAVFYVRYAIEKKYVHIPKRLASRQLYDTLLTAADSIGLGVFAVTGAQTAYSTLADCNVFTAVAVGMLTGVGGGVLRDILSGDIPYVLVRHVYACAAAAGVIPYALLRRPLGEEAAMLIGMGTVILIRFLAAHFKWNFPKITDKPS